LPGSAVAPAPVAGGEQAAYDTAFNSLKNADYPKAIAGLKNFLATYPDSPLASNAQYWLGEAYYVTHEYPNAINAFQQVVAKWPDSRKAPDAMVKVGFTQSAMGRNGDARVTLEDVVKRYPGTEAAQLATERLKRLPANAR
jgi:tol-pal system protein YbgF